MFLTPFSSPKRCLYVCFSMFCSLNFLIKRKFTDGGNLISRCLSRHVLNKYCVDERLRVSLFSIPFSYLTVRGEGFSAGGRKGDDDGHLC